MPDDLKDIANDVSNATESPTTFGRSVESKAQVLDAAKTAHATEPGEALNVYRLVPVAPPNDARWENVPEVREMLVAARTPGDARIVAAGAELDFMEVEALPGEDVTTRHGSIYRDEKAFTVIEVERDRHDLLRGPLDHAPRLNTIAPVTR
ncbi:MAG TPA: hypothetical protein VGO22_02120 [Pseudorhizobium sp.]|jgi:hypothetical protein|nr:hypothetical protein [Pseudorhizobium sp.]